MRYKRLMKQSIGNILSKTYGSFFLKNQKGLKVLMYHDIGDTNDFDLYKIKLSLFKKQIETLIKNKDILTIEDGIKNFSNIIITFDDSFTNIYNLVFPFLEEKKIHFTIFVICKFLENEYSNYININQLKEMSKSKYVTIGSHTHSHIDLNHCDDNIARYEIKDSKRYLEDIIGKNVDYFSYPYGSYSEKIKKILKNSGYKAAFCSKFGFFSNEKDLFNIPRLDIWSTDSLNSLNDKIEGKWNWHK
tara:strand:+ start:6440 stop:7177 length:738 start_codon:yes stop_codon:yes gene_type:complete